MTYNSFNIGDSIKAIRSLNIKIQTWIFDPPYNVGFQYDNVCDSLSVSAYEDMIQRNCQAMFDKAEEGGSLFLIHYPLDAVKLIPIIEKTGWLVHQWITWVYSHNMGMSKQRFTQGSRAVIWFSKGTPKVNIKAVKGEYKNPNDKRIKKRIAEGHSPALMDWWNINLRKNVSKGHRGYANSLPTELVKRCILTTSEKMDNIGDCMAGSGTTFEVSMNEERNTWLNDINPNCLSLWEGIEKEGSE